MRFFVFLFTCALAFIASPALAQPAEPEKTVAVLGVHFTPATNAAAPIVKAIDASEREVLVQAYGFTHNAIAQALVRAHERGVKVRVLLDQKAKAPIAM